MKTLKRVCFISFLTGSLLICTLFVQGQKAIINLTTSAFSSRPYADAGVDATICNDDNFQTHASSSSPMVIWYTSGDGYFINSKSINTIYVPGMDDIYNAEVILSLHQLCIPGKDCIKTSDEMTLHLGNCMEVKDMQ